MDGERYYRCAVALTDANPGVQFREMLVHDCIKSQVERLYFRDEWRDLPLMGWHTFCLRMEESDQKKWLAKIKELDGNVMLGHLESQLMQASRNGQAPNRAVLEATVKALQGVTALTKIVTESEMAAGTDGIEVKFIPSLDRPVEPEEWEKILVEKDPSLARYFGMAEPKPNKEPALPSNASETSIKEVK